MTLHQTTRQKLYITISAEAEETRPEAPPITHRETGDDYGRVLYLSPDKRLRIIICRDDRQWIVQTRRPFTSNSKRPWVAKGYCTSTGGLWRVLTPAVIIAAPELRTFLDALPMRFPRGAEA